MSFEEYFARLQSNNAGLRNLDSKMTMTIEAFKKALAAAHKDDAQQGENVKSIFERAFGKDKFP